MSVGKTLEDVVLSKYTCALLSFFCEINALCAWASCAVFFTFLSPDGDGVLGQEGQRVGGSGAQKGATLGQAAGEASCPADHAGTVCCAEEEGGCIHCQRRALFRNENKD